MLTRLVEIFQTGRIYPRTYTNPAHRPSWVWKACARQAEKVLTLILPYLVTKKSQAELALRARKLIGHSRSQGRGLGLTPNTNLVELADMAGQIVAMKRERKALV